MTVALTLTLQQVEDLARALKYGEAALLGRVARTSRDVADANHLRTLRRTLEDAEARERMAARVAVR